MHAKQLGKGTALFLKCPYVSKVSLHEFPFRTELKRPNNLDEALNGV